jgi:NAD(P)-dependent dehydrogenase (short-subunit alcohol dehydrogenase family)
MPVAIVTGASKGFGRALATDLAKDGWHLVVDARGAEDLARVAYELQPLGVEVRALAGDVADPAHRRRLVEEAARLGSPDLLVLNAGTLGPSPLPTLDTLDVDDLASILGVNVVAQLALVQVALPALRRARGTIVALTSDAAVEAYQGWGAYGSSKAALDALVAVLGVEEPGLHVYSFDPGDMRTDMHQAAFPGEDISDRPEPDAAAVPALRRLLQEVPPSGRYRAPALLAR